MSTFFSTLAGFGGNVSMMMLLFKATIILLVALGITLSMQRASAGARHLVWLVTVAALLLVPALTAWAPIPVRMLPPELSPAEASQVLADLSRAINAGQVQVAMHDRPSCPTRAHLRPSQ